MSKKSAHAFWDSLVRHGWLVVLVAILVLGALLPLTPLASNSLHHDETLYAHWATLIISGQDPMLDSVAVDKPPLYIYTVAAFFAALGRSDTAAQLPSMLAHIAAISLTFLLGQTLYHRRIGLLAALIVAISPFAILFAPTILTDPMLVAFVLLAAWLAAKRQPIGAGITLALAAATKQQGIFFAPLVLALLALPLADDSRRDAKTIGRDWLACLLTFAIGLAIPLIWDASRSYKPGFWLQSSLSYGPVSFGSSSFANRLDGFLQLLGYVTATPILNWTLAIGLPALLAMTFWRRDSLRARWADWILVGFAAGFVLFHTLFTFQIWDRYMLGLTPILALLLARILHLPAAFIKSKSMAISVIATVLVIVLMIPATRQAIHSQYPIGGDHGAYTGAKETAAWLRGHAGANVTVYHRWLGSHWRYYLFQFPYDFRFWQSAEELAGYAMENSAGVQYIAFPPWQSTTPASLALSDVGLHLQPVFTTYQSDGSPGIYLYQIVAE